MFTLSYLWLTCKFKVLKKIHLNVKYLHLHLIFSYSLWIENETLIWLLFLQLHMQKQKFH